MDKGTSTYVCTSYREGVIQHFVNISHIVAALDPSLSDKSGAYLSNAAVHNEKLAEYAADEVGFAHTFAVHDSF